MVEAMGKGARWALFAVLRNLVFHVAAPGCDEAGWGGHVPTGFDTAEPRGHGSASGVPSHANAIRINIIASEEIVEGTHGIPGAPSA